jgi:hypothetical protein
MIKNRIASTAALATFGLAALGGAVVAVAAPANAETGASGTTTSSDGTTTSGGTRTHPNSKVGSTPTPNVSSTGGAHTSVTSDGSPASPFLGPPYYVRELGELNAEIERLMKEMRDANAQSTEEDRSTQIQNRVALLNNIEARRRALEGQYGVASGSGQ